MIGGEVLRRCEIAAFEQQQCPREVGKLRFRRCQVAAQRRVVPAGDQDNVVP